jgi:hypothetical protein
MTAMAEAKMSSLEPPLIQDTSSKFIILFFNKNKIVCLSGKCLRFKIEFYENNVPLRIAFLIIVIKSNYTFEKASNY